MYDSEIGRWTCPDPMRVDWSPYVGMGNNPVSFTDPTGGDYGDAYGEAMARAAEAQGMAMMQAADAMATAMSNAANAMAEAMNKALEGWYDFIGLTFNPDPSFLGGGKIYSMPEITVTGTRYKDSGKNEDESKLAPNMQGYEPNGSQGGNTNNTNNSLWDKIVEVFTMKSGFILSSKNSYDGSSEADVRDRGKNTPTPSMINVDDITRTFSGVSDKASKFVEKMMNLMIKVNEGADLTERLLDKAGVYDEEMENQTTLKASDYKFSNQAGEPKNYSFGGSNPIMENDSLTQRRFYNENRELIKVDTVRSK